MDNVELQKVTQNKKASSHQEMKLNTPRYHSHWQKTAHSSTSFNVSLYNGRNRNGLISVLFSRSAQGGAMTKTPCRLAPTAGSLKVPHGFVSYHRISTYSTGFLTSVLLSSAYQKNLYN